MYTSNTPSCTTGRYPGRYLVSFNRGNPNSFLFMLASLILLLLILLRSSKVSYIDCKNLRTFTGTNLALSIVFTASLAFCIPAASLRLLSNCISLTTFCISSALALAGPITSSLNLLSPPTSSTISSTTLLYLPSLLSTLYKLSSSAPAIAGSLDSFLFSFCTASFVLSASSKNI